MSKRGHHKANKVTFDIRSTPESIAKFLADYAATNPPPIPNTEWDVRSTPLPGGGLSVGFYLRPIPNKERMP